MAPASTVASVRWRPRRRCPVAGVVGARDVVAGEFQCAAIDQAGALFTWGLNLDGALGRPARRRSRRRPGACAGLPPVRDGRLGKGYMLALTQDQRVYAWGGNAAGQLGLGHLHDRAVARRRCKLPHKVAAVAAGASHALALTTTGEVIAWGSNNHGQLGRDAPAYSTTPAAR